MDSKIIFCIVFATLSLSTNASNSISFADKLEKHVSDYVAIITPQTVSSTTSASTSCVIRQIMNKYPSIILNSIKNFNDIDDENLPAIQQLFQTKHQKQILKVIIIDAVSSKNVTQKLVDAIDFLIYFSFQSSRPKTLVFLYVKQKTNLKDLFQYSWSQKFLYVTVMEFIQEKKNSSLSSKHTNKFNVITHQYNPFNNYYHSENFSETTELFTEKLSDLHEFPLKFGVMSEKTYLQFQEDDSKSFSVATASNRDIKVAKTTTKTLNSKIEFKKISLAYPTEKVTTNLSSTECVEVGNCLLSDEVDYVVEWIDTNNFQLIVNTMDIVGKWVRPLATKSFLIKQYSNNKLKLTLIITVSLGVSIMCVLMLLLRSKFNEKVYTLYNIIKILIGIAVRPEPQKMSERIFFLCLTFVYCICFADIIQESFKTSNYREINTFKDITDAGIVPRVYSGVKELLLAGSEDEVKMAENLIVYDVYDRGAMNQCLSFFLQDNVQNYNCCEVPTDLGIQIVKKSIHDAENRLISLMKEPLGIKFQTFYHSSISPYKNRFDQILQRLTETGLLNHWGDRVNWIEEADTQLDYKYAPDYDNRLKNLVYLAVLGVCYILSIIVFFIEILYFKITQKYLKKIEPVDDEKALFNYTD